MNDLAQNLRSPARILDRAAGSIAARFERQVALTPDNHAVLTDTGAVTYRELDEMAGFVANEILLETAEDQSPVALLMKDSLSSIAAMLGAAKAGRVFIPFDLNFPESYIAETIKDSGASLVLTNAKPTKLLETVRGARVCVLQFDKYRVKHPAIPQRKNAVHPSSAAYILYTSGSTGKAKGVELSHEFLLRYVDLWSGRFEIGSGDRMSLLFSCNWGTGMHNAFVALLNGACVCPFDIRTRGACALSNWLSDLGITIHVTTSSLFRTWIASLSDERRFPQLRLIRNAAEPLYSEDIARAGRFFTRGCQIVHTMGTTETGTVAINSLDLTISPEAGVLPVGHAAAGVDIRIENEAGKPVKTGETGEIVVSGRYLALGYWKNAALTDAVFRSEPNDPTKRSYRTGDFGRWRSDGQLEYLGRKDRKVKLRGFTVELFEIERALLRLSDVQDAVVVISGDDPDHAQVVAYIVGPKDRSPDASQSIASRLAAHLPAHLIPSDIVILDSMPLTERGKVDRAALLQRSTRQKAPGARYRAPTDNIERALARIWRKVMKLPKLGIDDNFYTLGGTSLQAFLIFAQIAAEFGRDMPPTTMIAAPAIGAQAALLRDPAPARASSSLVPFRVTGSGQPLFVVHGGYGDVMFIRELALHLKSDRPVFGISPPILDGSQRIPRDMEALAAIYLAEIRKIQPAGPYVLAGYSFGGWVALEMAQQLRRRGEAVDFLGIIDTNAGATRAKRETGPARARRHMRALLVQDLRGTRSYLHVRVRKSLAYGFAAASLHVAPHLPKWVRTRLFRSPRYILRSDLYWGICKRIAHRYVAKPYAGRVVMFSAKGMTNRHRAFWGPLALDGLTTFEVPAGHSQMVLAPHSAILAAAFDAGLASR
jgi:amino acid adenylation domain-containing protein